MDSVFTVVSLGSPVEERILVGRTYANKVLLDSGADASFMDSNLARTLVLQAVPLRQQLRATFLD